MMLIGVICGLVMVKYVDRIESDASLYETLLSFLGLFLMMYVAFYFHIVVHEAGHLVFGLLSGYNFCSFRVLSFMWIKENGKIKFKRYSLVGTGGQCLMSPPDMKDGNFPIVLYNLGGSFANIITGAIFLVIHFICTPFTFLESIMLLLAVVGFMSAMMNGIPMRMGSVDNDGYNTFAMSKNTESREAFWVHLKVAEQSSKGLRLKDMPSEWFTVPTDEAMKNSMVAACGVFTCNRLIDEKRFEEAEALMAHFLEIDSGIVGLHRNLLTCDRIYVELISENRRELIEDMLTLEQKKFMRAMKRFPSVIRTQYAIALLFENDSEKAETIQKKFEKIVASYPYPRETEAERELMRLAQQKIHNHN